MKVRYKGRIVDAEQVSDTHWNVRDPEVFPDCVGWFDDDSFREVFENVYDNVVLTPRDLTEQLSQELQRWGMTPLPLDAPVEATLGLTLAAVRQITWDIQQVINSIKPMHGPDANDVRDNLEKLISCRP